MSDARLGEEFVKRNNREFSAAFRALLYFQTKLAEYMAA